MKNLPKSILIAGLVGLVLLLAGDLYNSFGFLVCTAGGLLLLAAWLLTLKHLSKSKSEKNRKIVKIVKIISFTAMSAVLLSFLIIEGLILAHKGGTEAPDADILIVLGAGLHGDQPSLTLSSRLKVALDYLNEHPTAVAVLTGGQGTGRRSPKPPPWPNGSPTGAYRPGASIWRNRPPTPVRTCGSPRP